MKTHKNVSRTYGNGFAATSRLKIIMMGLMLSLSLILAACGSSQQGTADEVEEDVEQGAAVVATEAAETGEEVERGVDVVEQEAGETLDEAQQGAEVAEQELAEVAEEAQQGAEVLEEEAAELVDVGPAVSIDEVMDNKDEYLSQTVVISGEVNEVYGENAFLVSDPVLIGGESLLVVSLNQPSGVVEDEMVQVVGELREYQRASIENDLGYEVDEILGDFTDDTVLVAQRISEIAGGKQIQLSDIADAPEMYAGETVTVTGEVSEQVAANVVRVNEDNFLDIGDEILVVYDPEAMDMNLAEDTEIRVNGVVTNFVEAELRDYVDPDLFPSLYVEYEERPTILANSITPLAD